MAGLKMFVSSTCYDLAEERNQLRQFISDLGHEPILSEYNEILYDFNEHTHVSCVREISNADMVILVIGTRFGGIAIDETKKIIDLAILQEKIHIKDLAEIFSTINKEKKIEKDLEETAKTEGKSYKAKSIGFSITQYEVLKAIEEDIPVYVFINERINNFYDFYNENKKSSTELRFPELTEETTKYLFEFIRILKRRIVGNFLIPYKNYSDIELALKNQLALKFKRLLTHERNEIKNAKNHSQQIDLLSTQFDDLKTAVLNTIQDDDRRNIAKGVANYRELHTFLHNVQEVNNKINLSEVFKKEKNKWDKVIDSFGFIDIKFSKDIPDLQEYINSRGSRRRINNRNDVYFLKENNFYSIPEELYKEIQDSWEELITMKEESRKIIFETLNDKYKKREYFNNRNLIIREHELPFKEWLESIRNEERAEPYTLNERVLRVLKG